MRYFYFFTVFMLLLACSDNDSASPSDSNSNFDENNLTGIFSLFPLALNPEFKSVSEINLSDNELVGILNFGSDIRLSIYFHK